MLFSLLRRAISSLWAIITAGAIILTGVIAFLVYRDNPQVRLVGELKPSTIVFPKAMRKDIDKLSTRVEELLKAEKSKEKKENVDHEDSEALTKVLFGRTWTDMPLLPIWWRFYSEINCVWTLTIRNAGNKEAQKVTLTVPSDIKVVQVERSGQATETHTYFKDFSISDLRDLGQPRRDEQTIDLKTVQPSEELIVYAWSTFGLLQDIRGKDFRLSHSEGLADISRPPSIFDIKVNPLERYVGSIITGVVSALSMALVLWWFNVGGMRPTKQPRKKQVKKRKSESSRQRKVVNPPGPA